MYSKYLDRQAQANSADPAKMPQKAAPNQGQHCNTHLAVLKHI